MCACMYVSVIMMFICLTCRKSWHILELKSLRIFYLCWVFQSKGRSRYSTFLWSFFFFLPLFCNCLCKDLQVFLFYENFILSLTCWLNNYAWSLFFPAFLITIVFSSIYFSFCAGSNGQSYRFALGQ